MKSINSSRYKEKLSVPYLFIFFSFPQGFCALLLAPLNRSLQFNFSVSELLSSSFSSSASSTLAFAAEVLLGTVPGELLVGRVCRVSRPRSEPALFSVGRRAGRNSQSATKWFRLPQRRQFPSWRRLSSSS